MKYFPYVGRARVYFYHSFFVPPVMCTRIRCPCQRVHSPPPLSPPRCSNPTTLSFTLPSTPPLIPFPRAAITFAMSSPPDRDPSYHPFREKLSQAVGKVHDKIQDRLNPSSNDYRNSDYSSHPSSNAPSSSSHNYSSSAYPSYDGRRVNPSTAQAAAYQSNRPAPNYSSSSYNRPENLPPRPPHYQRPAGASGPYQPRNNLHSSQQPSFQGRVGTVDMTDSPIGKKPEQPKFGETTPLKNNVPRTFGEHPWFT